MFPRLSSDVTRTTFRKNLLGVNVYFFRTFTKLTFIQNRDRPISFFETDTDI